jgi:ABC-type transport system involved in multi-copper enzyme maturation permease subunit
LLAGPLVTRELVTDPRKFKHFGIRAGYVAALSILMYTGAQATFALAPPRGLGDIARFGVFIFGLLSFVQLAVVIGTSLLFTAGSIAQEKDRRTLILLLMTDLRATELVIGKIIASLIPVFVIIAVSIPVFTSLTMLGGMTFNQVFWFEVLCLVSAFVAGSWGTLIAYWRDKTFQTIAITLLGAGLFLGAVEAFVLIVGEESTVGALIGGLNPFRSLNQLLHPLTSQPDVVNPQISAWTSSISLLGLASILTTWTCLKVRIWNPTRNVFIRTSEEKSSTEQIAHSEGQKQVIEAQSAPDQSKRKIWDTPIIWREICTSAYGKKVGLIKGAYFIVAVAFILWLRQIPSDAPLMMGIISPTGFAFLMLSLVSLILVNAQSVTSLTSERDGQTLELLLVTEVSAKEFIFGKMGGALFNMKEVVLVPLLFASMAWVNGEYGLESYIFITLGYLTLVLFANSLGIHSGLSFDNSRSAILNSLGTIFFLFVGVFVCMMLIVEARSSFAWQLAPFFFFICGGSLGLWMSLTHKNPSSALTVCAWVLPFLTFYGIVSYLLGNTAAVFMSVLFPFGFTVAAILIPAISAFDVALGRTTVDRG